RIENLENVKENKKLKIVKVDLRNKNGIDEYFKECDVVFHLAANPEVRILDPKTHYENNFLTTYNVLEAMRKKDVKNIVFTSSSTVYGEAKKIPTPEDYGPLIPISLYGSTKLACEGLICGYSHTYSMNGFIFRFANVVGGRSTHGVIYDFIQKLKKNKNELEILGDGTQKKSYIHVNDCIEAILYVLKKEKSNLSIYNIGNFDSTPVYKIADIVIDELGLKNVKKKFVNSANNGRGWVGDIKYMQLDISKITSLGWKPKLNSDEAVRKACKETINNNH
ncbi:MAG: NAD-dependent epimerase/dehydratase family protein, partial [Candidatus Micrarchaeia archaeon]